MSSDTRIVQYIEKVFADSYKATHPNDEYTPAEYILLELNGQLILFFDQDRRSEARSSYRIENNFERNFHRSIAFNSSFHYTQNAGGFTLGMFACKSFEFDHIILPIYHDGRVCTIETCISPKVDEDWDEYKRLPVVKYLTPNFFNRVEEDQNHFPGMTFCAIDMDRWYEGVMWKIQDDYRKKTGALSAMDCCHERTNWNDYCFVWKQAFGYIPKAMEDVKVLSSVGEWTIPKVDENYKLPWME